MQKGLWLVLLAGGVLALSLSGCGGGGAGDGGQSLALSADGTSAVAAAEAPTMGTMAAVSNYVVVAFNELGMHCMNRDFSKLMILPPFNTVRAQVIKRGEDPQIIRSGVTVAYSIPGNTRSSTKTNFWTYAKKLFGFYIAPDTGLTGTKLAGTMIAKGDGRYEATGIPVTPLMDSGRLNAYPLATVTAKSGTTTLASTQAVVPVSWEISCNLCHNAPDGPDMDILRDHDRLHGTDLQHQTPVACGKCHQQAPLAGALGSGVPGLPSLSRAMHGAHAPRMAAAGLSNSCYACHPGKQTNCQRDIHKANGMECAACHGGMTKVAATTRRPWVDEPKCGSCHKVPGHQYEEPGKLFRESRGHNGVYCTTCHNTPHAVVPTINPEDNVQNTKLQGYPGTLNKCSVCHTQQPEDEFNHSLDD